MSMISQIFNIIYKSLPSINNISQKKNQNWYNTNEQMDISKKQNALITESIKPALIHPVKIQKITSQYGWREILGKNQWHNGTDYSGTNKICLAITDCIITHVLKPDFDYPYQFNFDPQTGKFSRNNIPAGRGWTPFVTCQSMPDNKIKFIYRHLNPIVKKGEIIKAGSKIGDIGNYGFSMGAHLHFELYIFENGKWKEQNPQKFLIENTTNEIT